MMEVNLMNNIMSQIFPLVSITFPPCLSGILVPVCTSTMKQKCLSVKTEKTQHQKTLDLIFNKVVCKGPSLCVMKFFEN